MRRAVAIFSLAWAAIGWGVFALGFGNVNADARTLVGAAGIIGVGAALLAARSAGRGHLRLAGGLLVLSVITPTWFAAAVNLIPLAVGLVLVIGAPRTTLRRHAA